MSSTAFADGTLGGLEVRPLTRIRCPLRGAAKHVSGRAAHARLRLAALRDRRDEGQSYFGPAPGRGGQACREWSSIHPTSCRSGWGSSRRRRCLQRWSWTCSGSWAPSPCPASRSANDSACTPEPSTTSSTRSKFDFSRYRTVCDVGGATGQLCMVLAERHPHLRCTSYDLPVVAPIAEKAIAAAGLNGRVELSDRLRRRGRRDPRGRL
jgi:hypothetical protein